MILEDRNKDYVRNISVSQILRIEILTVIKDIAKIIILKMFLLYLIEFNNHINEIQLKLEAANLIVW